MLFICIFISKSPKYMFRLGFVMILSVRQLHQRWHFKPGSSSAMPGCISGWSTVTWFEPLKRWNLKHLGRLGFLPFNSYMICNTWKLETQAPCLVTSETTWQLTLHKRLRAVISSAWPHCSFVCSTVTQSEPLKSWKHKHQTLLCSWFHKLSY